MTVGIAGTCGVRVKAQSVQGRFVTGIVASAGGGFTKRKEWCALTIPCVRDLHVRSGCTRNWRRLSENLFQKRSILAMSWPMPMLPSGGPSGDTRASLLPSMRWKGGERECRERRRSGRNLFQLGDLWVAVNSNNIAPALRAKGLPIKFSLPAEGSPTVNTGMSLVKGAPCEAAAYEYINLYFTDEFQARRMASGTLSASKDAWGKITPELRADLGMGPGRFRQVHRSRLAHHQFGTCGLDRALDPGDQIAQHRQEG
jgi:hypothetical protein